MTRAVRSGRAWAAIGVVLWLLCAGGIASAAAATSDAAEPDPRQLWNAYPLEPGQGEPKVRLPADSAVPRRPVAATASRDDGGGVPVALLVGVAALALVVGAAWGHRARRAPRPVPDGGPRADATLAGIPERAPAARAAAPAPAPVPRPSPPPSPPPVEPSPPPPRRPATALSAPVAAKAPPPSGSRFRRVPWPPGAEAGWRCEITSHLGVTHADFRVMAHEPGRRRPAEIGRTRSYTRPGWGSQEPFEELSAMVEELVSALRDAGWEQVDQGREWFAARFVWSRSGTPPLDLRELATGKGRDDVR